MDIFLFITFISLSIVASVYTKKLTVVAALTGGVLSAMIYWAVGWIGIALMGAFFLLGTSATSWGRSHKEILRIAQQNGGRRNAGQVLANGGAGGLLGLLAILFPSYSHSFILMMAAAFSSATADTVSSELGSIYGKKFYDILSFKRGTRGDDGVISMEGLLFGMAGSVMISIIYAVVFGWNTSFYWIVIAGTIGNLADSFLGATLERRGILHNDAVNFLNTVVATLFMLLVI